MACPTSPAHLRAATGPGREYRWAIAVRARRPYRWLDGPAPAGGPAPAMEARAASDGPSHDRRAGEEPPPAAAARSSDARRRAAPDRRRGQRPARPRRPVPRRHRRVVRAVRRRPGRPVDVRRLADAAERWPRSAACRRRSSSSSPRCPRDATTAGMTAIREQRVQVMGGDLGSTLPGLREIYRRAGIRTICFVPIVFRDEPLGLLVLYHHSDYAWTRRRDGPRPRVRRPHGDRHRQRPAGRVDADAGRPPARRSPSWPAASTASRTSTGHRPGHRRRGASADRPRHDPRLPRRPRDRDVRADRVPGHVRWARPTRRRHACGSRIGEGLTGWVAEHGQTDPARRRRRRTRAASSSSRPASRSRCCSSR